MIWKHLLSIPFEDTADSIGSYADGENLAMQGEKNEIIVALDAFVKLENSKK